MKKTREEIAKRMNDIMLELDNENADTAALDTEFKSLKEDLQKIEERESLINEIKNGIAQPADSSGGGVPAETKSTNGSKKYISVLNKVFKRETLSEDERALFRKINPNAEYRDGADFFLGTQNAGAVVSFKTEYDLDEKRDDEFGDIMNDVNRMNYAGKYKMIMNDEADDAAWYGEGDEVTPENMKFKEIDLDWNDLCKRLRISRNLDVLAIPDFAGFVIREIRHKMLKAINNAILYGKGKAGDGDNFKNQPLGVITYLRKEGKNLKTVTKLDYKTLTEVRAAIPTKYASKITVYMNNYTLWTHVANILDENKRPIFVPDATGVVAGRILGMNVKLNPDIKDNEILFGDPKSYLLNVSDDVKITKSEHVEFNRNLINYMGWAKLDGKPTDINAWQLVQIGSYSAGVGDSGD